MAVKALINAAIDSSRKARMQRAEEQGRLNTSSVWNHGTNAEFEAFDPAMLGTASGASDTKHGFYFGRSTRTSDAYRETFPSIKPEKFKEKFGVSMEEAQKRLDGMEADFASRGLEVGTSTKNRLRRVRGEISDSDYADIEKYQNIKEKLNPYFYNSPEFPESQWIDHEMGGRNIEAYIPNNMHERNKPKMKGLMA